MGWLVLWAVLGADLPATDAISVTGTASQATSGNFEIVSYAPTQDAREVAKLCEQWREKLGATWRKQADATPWNPRCDVVVHRSRQSYVAAVGRGGQSSLGSTWIEFAGKAVSKRRIDLLPDNEDVLSALPHELTHVVIADCLGGKQLPRWADEGMAILADSQQKRKLHQRDLEQALHQRQAFSCGELLALGDYPAHARIPAFYGQSAAMVALLCQRGTPARFLEFVQLTASRGHDAALKETYGLAGVAELEQLWRRDLTAALNFHDFRLTLAD